MITAKDLEEISTFENKTYTNAFFVSKTSVENFYSFAPSPDIYYFKALAEVEEDVHEILSQKSEFPETINEVKLLLGNYHEDFFYSSTGKVIVILTKETQTYKAEIEVRMFNEKDKKEIIEFDNIKELMNTINLKLRDSMKSGEFEHDIMSDYVDGDILN